MIRIIILAITYSAIIRLHNTTKGPNPASRFPGIILCLDGNPKKYLTGSGDLTMTKEIVHAHTVAKIIVVRKEPRYAPTMFLIPVKSAPADVTDKMALPFHAKSLLSGNFL